MGCRFRVSIYEGVSLGCLYGGVSLGCLYMGV